MGHERAIGSSIVPVRAAGVAWSAAQWVAARCVRCCEPWPDSSCPSSQRFRPGGLERALYERARPGKAAWLDALQRQRIVALVCGPPPAGRARWTVRLLTEEVVQRNLVPRVGRETIRVLLESHELKPWRGKNVVRGATG
ncbi:MAG TPA: helix-turn-helix domain-containing protein [Terriglobales bacterium]|nr:helix-turn-helix domain-containing protein [Terriglobales bacterium]